VRGKHTNKGVKMKVKEILKKFKDEKKPIVSAAAFLGVHPETIKFWEKKGGYVPEQWAALYREKTKEEAK
jgi:DNA-binding transcriptional MerR regulator